VSARVAAFLRGLQIPATGHQPRHRWAGDYHALDPDRYRQAKLMGHGSVNTTQRYTKVSRAEAARHIAALTRRRFDGTAHVADRGIADIAARRSGRNA
jgi:integrase